jgi:hypothetical protein
MKKVFLLTAICGLLSSAMLTAQADPTPLGAPDTSALGADAAGQTLSEISVDLFEQEGFWSAKISPDNGIVTVSLHDGSPAAKEPLQAVDGEPEQTDTKVLGVKVEFFRRGVNTFYITAARPLPIEGEVKTISFWVVGRNQPHKLSLIVQDYNGAKFELAAGTLDFAGWKKLTVAVPPSPDGIHGIVQSSAFFGDKPGLRIVGFKIDCDPLYTRGAFYIYFDDLRAITDLYLIQNRDEDDLRDDW